MPQPSAEELAELAVEAEEQEGAVEAEEEREEAEALSELDEGAPQPPATLQAM